MRNDFFMSVGKLKRLMGRGIDYLSKDPKAIFDHVRNVGIAGAMILGAGFIRERFSSENPPFTFYIPVLIILASGILLLVMNLLYAQRAITASIYGKGKTKSLIRQLRFTRRLIVRRNKISQVKRRVIYKLIMRRHIANYAAQIVLVIYFTIVLTLLMIQYYSSNNAGFKDSKKLAHYELFEQQTNTIAKLFQQNQNLREELSALRTTAVSQESFMIEQNNKIIALTEEIKLMSRKHGFKVK